MRTSLFFLWLCLSCAPKPAQEIDLAADLVSPKHYVVTKAASPITVDGTASDAAWAQAEYTDYFIDIEGVKTPKFKTRIKMLWDEQFFYVFAEMEEPHIWGDIKTRDAVIFYNNDFEVFVDPSGDTKNYGEVEINALNTVWDLHLDKPYRVSGKANDEWNLDNLQSAVKIYGTLNNSSDTDSLWTLEIAIPLKPLTELKTINREAPAEGEVWRVNFSRVNWDFDLTDGVYSRKKVDGKYAPEYNWVWSNQKVINMHEPEKWGFVQFTHGQSAAQTERVIDPEFNIKQAAYALFRHAKYGSLTELQSLAPLARREFRAAFSENEKPLHAVFHKTHTGFEFVIEDSRLEKTLVINEEGVLSSID